MKKYSYPKALGIMLSSIPLYLAGMTVLLGIYTALVRWTGQHLPILSKIWGWASENILDETIIGLVCTALVCGTFDLLIAKSKEYAYIRRGGRIVLTAVLFPVCGILWHVLVSGGRLRLPGVFSGVSASVAINSFYVCGYLFYGLWQSFKKMAESGQKILPDPRLKKKGNAARPAGADAPASAQRTNVPSAASRKTAEHNAAMSKAAERDAAMRTAAAKMAAEYQRSLQEAGKGTGSAQTSGRDKSSQPAATATAAGVKGSGTAKAAASASGSRYILVLLERRGEDGKERPASVCRVLLKSDPGLLKNAVVDPKALLAWRDALEYVLTQHHIRTELPSCILLAGTVREGSAVLTDAFFWGSGRREDLSRRKVQDVFRGISGPMTVPLSSPQLTGAADISEEVCRLMGTE